MHSVFNKKLQRDHSVSRNVDEFEILGDEDVSSLASEEENDFESVNREDIDLKEETIAGFTKEKVVRNVYFF